MSCYENSQNKQINTIILYNWNQQHATCFHVEWNCSTQNTRTNISNSTANCKRKIWINLPVFRLFKNENCKILTLTPVTSMSLRQFSAVSWVQRCPSTHQSHGNEDETHCVHELYVLQSKNVKFVVTKSGPDVMRTDNLAVKWSATKRH